MNHKVYPENISTPSKPEEEEEYMQILCNREYGGYGFSDTALQMYNERKSLLDPSYNPIKYDCEISRNDTTLIEIYNELGSENFSDHISVVKIVSIPKKYKNCYKIDEYDGKESVSINYIKYDLLKINEIVHSDKNNDEKIEEIKKIKSIFDPSIMKWF